MTTSQMSGFIQHLRRAVLLPDGAGMTDGQLLEDYISRRDEAALAALVRRHGPMVWGVCRRVLRNYHDAEDAFQATFLVLVRRAASIASRKLVGNWLYGVAHQTALKARATVAKKNMRERQVTEMPQPAVAEQDLWNDLQPLLDEELTRLPEKYRVVIALCDLEGKTRKEAARQLGCPEGTVAGRLARARALLAKRLSQRGVALSGGALAAVLAQQAVSAGVPYSVVDSTIKAASLLAAGKAAATGAISVKVAALTEGVMNAMLFSKLRAAIAVVLILGFVATGATILTCRTAAGQDDKNPAAEKPVEPAAKREKEKEAFTGWDKGDAEAPKKAAPKTDEEKLQGVWKLVRMEAGGQVASEEETSHGPELVFDGNRIENDKGKQPAPFLRGAFTLDTTKNPKKITLITDFGGASYPSKGVYELDGDDLKICIDFNHVGKKNYEETTELKTIAGTSRVLYSFKREKAKKEDLPKEKKTAAKIGDLKADLTAWGTEINGLQAGLGFRPGEQRPYTHGETVNLVVRVRNVSKKEVNITHIPAYFFDSPPSVTDGEGKAAPQLRLPSEGHEGEYNSKELTLAPGKEVELAEVRIELRPESERDNNRLKTLYGTGKFQIHYERVMYSSGKYEIGSILSDLATGKLELEIKPAPPAEKK